MPQLTDVLRDTPVVRELSAIVESGSPLPGAAEAGTTPDLVRAVIASPGGEGRLPLPRTEAVILQFTRPALLVRNGRIVPPRSKTLAARLLSARARLEPRVASVGRIEFRDHPAFGWGGTGWLIADRTVVTNRHVAENFARREGRGYGAIVTPATGRPIQTRLDFREEHRPTGRSRPLDIDVARVLFMAEHDTSAPDIAFLELRPDDRMPEPIPLSRTDPRSEMDIAVVGFPSRDTGGMLDDTDAKGVFGDIFDVKRVSPGKALVVDTKPWYFTHDASTLRGSSGSAVLDMEGNAVGLHFSGIPGEANHAVKPTALLDALARVKRRSRASIPADPAERKRGRAADPLEAAVSEYEDREGFDPAFLGAGAAVRVNLPEKTTAPRDVLMHGPRGKRTGELKYEHFSVAMSKSRRLCLWSAVNISGDQKKSARRRSWLIDPRIPRDAQLLPGDGADDVYGDPPRFARGHMTRREDPIWGPVELAERGNRDSMHYTNAVPQMQPFNAGIWLGLEDYALQHCVEDQMRISVITGPVLRDDDPTRFGTQIPLRFWKVIAFTHDDTRKLTATGYLMSQETYLAPEEFVFGAHETWQRPISEIEKLAGLSFDRLSSRDPLRRQPESLAAPLTDYADITFVA